MRRALFLNLLFASTCASIGLFGKTYPPVGGFSISAEWLYMLNGIDIPFFAQNGQSAGKSTAGSSDLAPNGNRVANDQDWNSGYRLEGVFQFCDADYLTLRWTQFPEFSNSKDDTAQPSLLASAGVVNDNALGGTFSPPLFATDGDLEASIKQKFSFYDLELLYGREIYACSPFYLTVNAGAQYVYLRFKEFASFNGVEVGVSNDLVQTNIQNESKREGVGPELGFEMEYDISSCFSAVARGWGALLITRKNTRSSTTELFGADANRHNKQTVTPAIASNDSMFEDDDGYWLLTPAADFRMGLNFDWCVDLGCNCPAIYYLNLEVGYEVLAYFRAIDRIHNVSDVDTGNSFNEYSNFLLHGPYLQLGISF